MRPKIWRKATSHNSASDVQSWEDTFSSLQKHLQKLESEYTHQPKMESLFHKWQGWLDLQRSLREQIDRVLVPSKEERFLDSKEKPFLHWVRQFAKQLAQYLELSKDHLTLILWTKLVQARLAGPTVDSKSLLHGSLSGQELKFEDEHFLHRENQIKETIKQLNQEKQSLSKTYHLLAVQKENQEAIIHEFYSAPPWSILGKSNNWLHSDDSRQLEALLKKLEL